MLYIRKIDEFVPGASRIIEKDKKYNIVDGNGVVVKQIKGSTVISNLSKSYKETGEYMYYNAVSEGCFKDTLRDCADDFWDSLYVNIDKGGNVKSDFPYRSIISEPKKVGSSLLLIMNREHEIRFDFKPTGTVDHYSDNDLCAAAQHYLKEMKIELTIDGTQYGEYICKDYNTLELSLYQIYISHGFVKFNLNHRYYNPITRRPEGSFMCSITLDHDRVEVSEERIEIKPGVYTLYSN